MLCFNDGTCHSACYVLGCTIRFFIGGWNKLPSNMLEAL